MELMFFDSIYNAKGKIRHINKIEQLVSDKPKDNCPLYGAFISKDNTRKVSNILYRTALTIDIDEIKGNDDVAREIILNIISYLNSLFSSWILHETHSSKVDNRRIRIIIPIGKISTVNYPRFAKAFLDDFNKKLNKDNAIVIDKKSYEPQQLMYLIPATSKVLGHLDGENNIEWIIKDAKNIDPVKRKVFVKPENTNTDNFYSWLSDIGMKYIIDKYYSEKYRFNKELNNGEFEYKDLNSKKKSGVRITKDNQVIVSWHDGDEFMLNGNGVKRANIYQMLKAKRLVEELYQQYRTEKGMREWRS